MMLPKIFTPVFFSLLGAVLLNGCIREEPEFYDGTGKRPVYIAHEALKDIRSQPPRSIGISGTIFLRDTLLFMLEQRKGIHVFNLKDSLNTVNLAFLQIPAVTDFTVSDHYIYADSWRDLVIIDIGDLSQIREVGRVEDVITPVLYPLLYNGIFECVDESKGAVIDWEDAILKDARCFTTN